MRVCRRGRSDRDVMSGRSADGGDVVIVCCGTSGDSVFSTGGIGEVPGVSMSTRFNKIATQGAPQMAVDKEANSLSRVYSYYSKFNLRLFYV